VDLVLRQEEREKVKIGDLVGVLYLFVKSLVLPLLLASAPTSPVKGKSSVLKMVSSSLVAVSSEVASRAFDDPSR